MMFGSWVQIHEWLGALLIIVHPLFGETGFVLMGMDEFCEAVVIKSGHPSDFFFPSHMSASPVTLSAMF